MRLSKGILSKLRIYDSYSTRSAPLLTYLETETTDYCYRCCYHHHDHNYHHHHHRNHFTRDST